MKVSSTKLRYPLWGETPFPLPHQEEQVRIGHHCTDGLMERSNRGAVYSLNKKHRYLLWSQWDNYRDWVHFVMLNPSTATELVNDPTVQRCEKRGRLWGYGGVLITNLFAYRATDPAVMRRAVDPVGKYNDEYIRAADALARKTVCAWGRHGSFKQRSSRVARFLLPPLFALRVSVDNTPYHPLYLSYALQPKPWSPGKAIR